MVKCSDESRAIGLDHPHAHTSLDDGSSFSIAWLPWLLIGDSQSVPLGPLSVMHFDHIVRWLLDMAAANTVGHEIARLSDWIVFLTLDESE
jgi:hypothetical protein